MTHFDLFLFSTNPSLVEGMTAAGGDGFVVDWERRGKADRQAGSDTEVGSDTVEDLVAVRAATPRRLLCRLNPFGPWTAEELDRAIQAGADEVLLPMAREPDEVASVIDLAAGRCRVGMLVETEEAVDAAPEFGRLDISRAFMGLNDLAIGRGSESIFEAVADGTVERCSEAFDVPFGFAGLTLPDLGDPVPCRLLLAEMERLGCSFAFLRRSFRRDVPPHSRPLAAAVGAIRAAIDAAKARPASERDRDREALLRAIDHSVRAPSAP